MTKKKVLILGKLPPPYMGPAIATEILLRSSLRNVFEIIHLNTKVNESLDNIGKFSFGKIFRSYAIYWRMIKIMKSQKPDLVLVPFSQDTVPFIKDSFFIIIAKLFHGKVLLHLRGSNLENWLNKSTALTRWFVGKMFSRTDGVIVLGNNLRYLFKKYFSPEKIFVVPNGSNYRIPVVNKFPGKSIHILYLANLQASKGIEDVLLAMKELKQRDVDGFELKVIGLWRNNEFKKKCMDMIEADQLPVTVFPPKSGDEKMSALSEADIFVFTPREPEGHPWVIVEALASGLPVISTDQGAIVESVLEGKNGFIVNNNSPVQIAEKLLLLVKDEALRKQMSMESRRHYTANFTEEKMVERLTNTFNEVIG
ncbi:MAG: glycosyltransferase family 4 protein [Bacteroidota bacterium]